MRNIILSVLLVVSLVASIMYIGAKITEAYTQSCVNDKVRLQTELKDQVLRARWYRDLTPAQQDSVKALRKAIR